MECDKTEHSEVSKLEESQCDEQQNEKNVLWGATENNIVNSEGNITNSVSSVPESNHKTVKIVVFGKDGAGKTALIVRLLTRRFIHEYDPTSEDVYAHHCVIEGNEVKLKIMDTAGMVERNLHEREEQIRWGDGFLLVLSLTSEESLKVLYFIKALIEEVKACEKPMALVANKRDLLHAREVSSTAVADLANKWHCPAFETAATEDYDVVEEPFIFLCTEVIKKRMSRTESPSITKLDDELVLADVSKCFKKQRHENTFNSGTHAENSGKTETQTSNSCIMETSGEAETQTSNSCVMKTETEESSEMNEAI